MVSEEGLCFVKKTSGSFWFYKTKVFPLWKKLWSLQKAHQQKKKNAELVGDSYKRLPTRQFGVFKIWANLDTSRCFFQTTQKQLPVHFPSLKSNTRRTGIRIVWTLLEHVWKSSLEDLTTGVIFKKTLNLWENWPLLKKKTLSLFFEKQRLFYIKTKFQSRHLAQQ